MPKKLKAGSLLLVVAIATILAALMLGMLLLLGHLRRLQTAQLIDDRLQRNLQSALAIALIQDAGSPDSLVLDLYGQGNDSVRIQRKAFGIYRYAWVEAFGNGRMQRKAALTGTQLTEAERYTLFLADEDRPLSLSGDTWIQGLAFLPAAGVRKAYIEGEQYQHEKAVQGTIQDSKPQLPALNASILSTLRGLLKGDTATLDRAGIVYEETQYDSVHRSFFEPTRLWAIPDSVLRTRVRGNVIVYSEGPLRIGREALLEDVVVIASSIRVEAGFSGSVQLFARDSIVIGADSFLHYPSAVGLLGERRKGDEGLDQPHIRIEQGATVDGMVFTDCPGGEPLLGRIDIEPEATVNGQVYADGLLQLQGTVNGVTLARRFFLKTPSTIYENFILNGRMDFDRLSRYYVGSPLLQTGKVAAVIKWLE